MEALGINAGLLIIQLIVVMLMIGLPVISLMDLSKKRLSATPLAVWALLICVVPLIGSLAYWIIKPTAESQV